jgi:hypothetical protein
VVGSPLTYIDPDGEAPTKAIVYFVKGVNGIYRAVKRSAAVRAASRRAHAVKVTGHGASKEARRVAAEANPSSRIVRHDPHRPGELPHYQPSTGGKGHVGYVIRDLASGLTVAHYLSGQGSVAEFLGQVVDFFNPLSIGQDMVDLYLYGLDSYGYHTGTFISGHDLFLSGAMCIEGICV